MLVLSSNSAKFFFLKFKLQVKYHEDFEKSKGHKIQVADDPELTRHLQNTRIQSQVFGIF